MNSKSTFLVVGLLLSYGISVVGGPDEDAIALNNLFSLRGSAVEVEGEQKQQLQELIRYYYKKERIEAIKSLVGAEIAYLKKEIGLCGVWNKIFPFVTPTYLYLASRHDFKSRYFNPESFILRGKGIESGIKQASQIASGDMSMIDRFPFDNNAKMALNKLLLATTQEGVPLQPGNEGSLSGNQIFAGIRGSSPFYWHRYLSLGAAGIAGAVAFYTYAKYKGWMEDSCAPLRRKLMAAESILSIIEEVLNENAAA